METIARLAVLLSCAAATGGLLVILARPHPAGGHVRVEGPGSLRGVVPAALAGYVLLAGGAALTGAGTLDAGLAAAGLRVGGIGLLVETGLLAGPIAAPSGPRPRGPWAGWSSSCGRVGPSRSSAGSWRSAPFWSRSSAACGWDRIADASAR